MKQPYIFKKQILSLCVIFIALVFSSQVNASIFTVLIFYFFIAASATLVPSLRKNIKYPIILHTALFYLPLYVPLFFYRFGNANAVSLNGILLGLLFGLVLYGSKVKELKHTYSSANLTANSKITLREFLISLTWLLVALIGEELFFRYFLINILWYEFGYISILISTALFLHIHWINRWANKMFTKTSYLYLGVFSASVAFLYITTRSIIACALAHFIFNFSKYYTLAKRLLKRDDRTVFFDDY